jgi:hypothetical protein
MTTGWASELFEILGERIDEIEEWLAANGPPNLIEGLTLELMKTEHQQLGLIAGIIKREQCPSTPSEKPAS